MAQDPNPGALISYDQIKALKSIKSYLLSNSDAKLDVVIDACNTALENIQEVVEPLTKPVVQHGVRTEPNPVAVSLQDALDTSVGPNEIHCFITHPSLSEGQRCPHCFDILVPIPDKE
jgi:hypothetical protein